MKDVRVKEIKRKCATKGCSNRPSYFVTRAADCAGTPNLCPDCVSEAYEKLLASGKIDGDSTADVFRQLYQEGKFNPGLLLNLKDALDDLEDYADFSSTDFAYDSTTKTFTAAKSGEISFTAQGPVVAVISSIDTGITPNGKVYLGSGFVTEYEELDPTQAPFFIVSPFPISIKLEANEDANVTGDTITFSRFEIDELLNPASNAE